MTILTVREVRQRPRKRRTFELTVAEQAHVRRALRVIRERVGSWEALARKLGCTPDTLTKAASVGFGKRYAPSAALALRAAQAVGVPVEAVLSGEWVKDIPCPLCGRAG